MQKVANKPQAVQVTFPDINGTPQEGTWGEGADIVFRNAFYMNFKIEFLDLNETYSISSFNTGLNFESGIIGEGWVISFEKVDDSTIIINWEGSHNKNLYYTDPWSWNIPKPYFSAKPKGSGVLSISLSMVKSGSNVQSKIRIEDDNYNLLLDKSGTFSIPSGSLYEKCLIFPETNPSITFNANKADGDNYHLDGNRVKITNLTLNDTELFLESSNKGDFAPLAFSARITDYIFPKLPNYSQLPGFYHDVNYPEDSFKINPSKVSNHDEITTIFKLNMIDDFYIVVLDTGIAVNVKTWFILRYALNNKIYLVDEPTDPESSDFEFKGIRNDGGNDLVFIKKVDNKIPRVSLKSGNEIFIYINMRISDDKKFVKTNLYFLDSSNNFAYKGIDSEIWIELQPEFIRLGLTLLKDSSLDLEPQPIRLTNRMYKSFGIFDGDPMGFSSVEMQTIVRNWLTTPKSYNYFNLIKKTGIKGKTQILDKI